MSIVLLEVNPYQTSILREAETTPSDLWFGILDSE